MPLAPAVIAAVLTFITYSLSGHTLDAATIFASLQLFNIIRQPLVMLPMALTICSDAYAGLIRIAKALLAEELEDELIVDSNAPDVRTRPLACCPSRAGPLRLTSLPPPLLLAGHPRLR